MRKTAEKIDETESTPLIVLPTAALVSALVLPGLDPEDDV